MKNIVKFRKKDGDASSSFLHLPDKIILQILNKLIDLKTLCYCYLVSRRFSSIVLQVDAISYTAPLIKPPIPDTNTVGDDPVPPITSLCDSESFLCAYRFLSKFEGVKSLCIEFPSFTEIGIDNPCLFKWMVKFGSILESFIFLSPNSIFDRDGCCLKGNGDEDLQEVTSSSFKHNIFVQCMRDAMAMHMMLLYFVKNLPMPILEKFSITDSGRRGRLSLSRKKLIELKECVNSELNDVKVPYVASYWGIPVLKLPVSGYVMKGVYVGLMKMNDLKGPYDGLTNRGDDFEDKEESAYNEAVMEILENHKARMPTWFAGVVS